MNMKYELMSAMLGFNPEDTRVFDMEFNVEISDSPIANSTDGRFSCTYLQKIEKNTEDNGIKISQHLTCTEKCISLIGERFIDYSSDSDNVILVDEEFIIEEEHIIDEVMEEVITNIKATRSHSSYTSEDGIGDTLYSTVQCRMTLDEFMKIFKYNPVSLLESENDRIFASSKVTSKDDSKGDDCNE